MIFAQALKLRDKLSRKRNILLEDEEKPFLEHLDDLRTMLMRIVITLLVSVTLCFSFNSWLFKTVKYPLEIAGLASAAEQNLPEGISQEQWKSIHSAARGASVLEGASREFYFSKAVPDPKLRAYAEAMLIYHAADLLPAEQQTPYLEEATRLLPAAQHAAALEAGRAILKARPGPSLEALKPVIQNIAVAPAEAFMLSMKLSMYAGIVIAFPLLFYFLLEFVLPGLNPKERKLLWPALSIGFGLFLTGVLFCFYLVVPKALSYFYEYGRELDILSTWRIGDTISFITTFCLIFGASFELPVVVMIMVKLGLLTSATMRRTRSWAIVIIVTAGAILTPTGDILTLSLLSGPMVVMYEICIWLAVALEKKNAREEAAEAERDMARRAALFGVASVPAAKPGSGSSPEGGVGPGLPPGPGPDDLPPASGVPHDDPYHHDAWDGHPHHPDPDKPTPDEEYAQYMREHAHLFPPAETHPESTPVEERGLPLTPTMPEAAPEIQAEAKAEATSEAKAEATPEAKAEATSEAKAEAQAEATPEAAPAAPAPETAPAPEGTPEEMAIPIPASGSSSPVASPDLSPVDAGTDPAVPAAPDAPPPSIDPPATP